MTTILIIAEPGRARAEYEATLRGKGVDCVAVADPLLEAEVFRGKAVGGVLFDVPTMIRAKEPGKSVARQLMDIYPSAQARFDAEAGLIRTLYAPIAPHQGRETGSGDPLDDFLNDVWESFHPRAVRDGKRQVAHFNALYRRSPDMPWEDAPRAVTANISERGLFLCSMASFAIGERVETRLLELEDISPMLVEIRWVVPWGAYMRLPGFGGEFLTISEAQRQELAAWLKT